MVTISFILAICHVVSSNQRLLQQYQQPMSIMGAHGQTCTQIQTDFSCSYQSQPLSDEGSGVLECGIEYDCCFCSKIRCGYTGASADKPCDTFKAGANYAVYGVKDIVVYGKMNDKGAIIDCNGEHACAETRITGHWVDTVRCSADSSCSNAVMEMTNSRGIICGKNACVGTSVTLHSNRGGELICGAENACVGANIEIEGGIFDIKCNGHSSCKGTKIVVNDPLNQFRLDCNGDESCNNLDLTIKIPEPSHGCMASLNQEPVLWKGVNCGSNGACAGMQLTVINNGCDTILIEDLQCSAGDACTGAIFDLNSGTGMVEIKNCLCGPSCQQAVGLDLCYDNIALFDCPDVSSCANQVQTIHNPANDFVLLCANVLSCQSLHLDIIINGASQNLIQRFDRFICNANMACQNAQINIQNTQVGTSGNAVFLTINEIQCTANNACDGTVFTLNNNVWINTFICANNACNNCMVKQTQNSQQISIPCTQFGESTTTQAPVVVNIYNPEPPIISIPTNPNPAIIPPPMPAQPRTTVGSIVNINTVPHTTKNIVILPPNPPQFIPQYLPAQVPPV